MLRLNFIGLVLVISILSFQGAHAYECPKNVAYVIKDPISETVVKFVKSIYDELGCKTNFVDLPGKRALVSFNTGSIDGESFRLEIAEKIYKVPFVRSDVPLFRLRQSLWRNPENPEGSIGIQRGIIWQESYAKTHKSVAFNNTDEIIDAYNKGTTGGFLFSDVGVNSLIEKKQLVTAPSKDEEVSSAQAYHYLHADYREFMSAFSEFIKERDIFGAKRTDAD